MKINQDQLITAFNKYFENEILNKAPNGWEKFKVGFLYGQLRTKLPKLIGEIKENPIVKAIEVFDPDGFIDVDEVIKNARESLSKTGKITISNLTFNDADLDAMYRYLREA